VKGNAATTVEFLRNLADKIDDGACTIDLLRTEREMRDTTKDEDAWRSVEATGLLNVTLQIRIGEATTRATGSH